MNLVFPKKSRKKPVVGDVFVFQLIFEPEQYRFGMVVSTTMEIVTFKNVILVYIYDHLGKNKEDFPDFSAKKLLIPPEAVNTLGWSRGFFETVAKIDLEKHPEYRLPQHHFACAIRRNVFYDEHNNVVVNPAQPIGSHGLGNYRVIEDAVCRKLSYPLSKD